MITFKYIREIYEKEKKHRSLQKLDDNFIEKIKEYLTRKNKLIQRASKTVIDYSIINEVENFKSLLKNLFELREKKILILALNHSNALQQHPKYDFSTLLDFERKFYEEINKNILQYKKTLFSILEEKEKVEEEIKNNEKKINIKEPEASIEERNTLKEKKDKNDKKTKYMVEAQDIIPAFLTPSKTFMGPYLKGERFVCDNTTLKILKKLNKVKILYEIE